MSLQHTNNTALDLAQAGMLNFAIGHVPLIAGLQYIVSTSPNTTTYIPPL